MDVPTRCKFSSGKWKIILLNLCVLPKCFLKYNVHRKSLLPNFIFQFLWQVATLQICKFVSRWGSIICIVFGENKFHLPPQKIFGVTLLTRHTIYFASISLYWTFCKTFSCEKYHFLFKSSTRVKHSRIKHYMLCMLGSVIMTLKCHRYDSLSLILVMTLMKNVFIMQKHEIKY